MARPQVFVSSTYYDLKHIRASLEGFIESLGYDAILSDKGRIAYDPDIALDESCYRAAKEADIFILIIGGRYGSETSESVDVDKSKFYERYESVTKTEFLSASKEERPIYILVEKAVYSEYETFKKNRENDSIEYAHVDSVNIFTMLDEILAKRRNNPMHQFEKHTDIENWLKEQWAGLFRELLDNRNSNKKLVSLSDKVEHLSEINSSLQTYLEEVIRTVNPDGSSEIIRAEHAKLSESQLKKEIMEVQLIESVTGHTCISYEKIVEIIKNASSMEEIADSIEELSNGSVVKNLYKYWKSSATDINLIGVNKVRKLLGLPSFKSM
ncbi:hypothetical protein CWB73_00380 [Pseudoalteromonas phenolica]|uniref:DUF4062 domain-containing protein n=1 Tax=Pseudoalteromonas phenolica TaxID=161398 RepID=A0A5S3Z019_9GAMM|nr:DUF4062 domain-containing protein [Pseudoalteromonas phenolica]TMP84158.1 hypothetical protein CWB73_00380 [Pseudoalteromonas phenolica]